MPTVVLHSGLSSSKTTTEPTSNVAIHAPQATNTALPKLIALSLPYGLINSEAHVSSALLRVLSCISSSTESSSIA